MYADRYIYIKKNNCLIIFFMIKGNRVEWLSLMTMFAEINATQNFILGSFC